MQKKTIIVRGAGDIATGVIQKLHRAGFNVLALEISKPSAVRREVALSECVYENKKIVEDISSVLVKNIDEIRNAWDCSLIPVIVDENMKIIQSITPDVFVEATISKKNTGINKNICSRTIALGPGYNAGVDVDIVIETNRGHNLGRLIFEGFAEADTKTPGSIQEKTFERVLYAPCIGTIENLRDIGDLVKVGDVVSIVDGVEVKSKLDGLIRGLIRNGATVKKNMKIGDVDPRVDTDYKTISDKARAIGGGVLEGCMILLNKI